MTRPHWLPDHIWIGITIGEWPVKAFPNEDMAARWAAESSTRSRRIWCVDIPEEARTYTAVPVPATHRIEEATA